MCSKIQLRNWTMTNYLTELLGNEADDLLNFKCKGIPKESIHCPGSDFIDRVWVSSDRTPQVLRSLQILYNHGQLKDTGYLSILPVDQGIEHSAGSAFAPNPSYFDPENIVKLAIDGGCNAVVSTLGALGSIARKYAHKIPFIVKINHNELLTYPEKYDQIMFSNIKQAWNMGCIAVGATIYFGSAESDRQIVEVSKAFAEAHELGMATVLWCYLRNSSFKQNGIDYQVSADLTGQANHLGVTIQADIIKQKLPENNGGFKAIGFGKFNQKMYGELCSEHPIDLVRWQVANNYLGRVGLINSGGASGSNDFKDVIRTAVINKRGGGMGLITGRKAFQRPLKEGIKLLNDIQNVYLDKNITIA
jgi:class I fructose-bisphosphate aldolase